MARMIPNIPENYNFNNSPGEKAVYFSLKKLEDEIVVFHSLEWKGFHHGKIIEGESDIVLYVPEYGVLVIEVKSGGVKFENGSWYQTNLSTDETIKLGRSPLEQARRSKYQIINRLKENNIFVKVEAAIWLTTVSKQRSEIEDINIKSEQIFWKEDLKDPMPSIKRCFEYFGFRKLEYDKHFRRNVIDILSPTFGAIPTGKDIIEYNEYNFVRMTREQFRILDFLVEQQEASIMGGAGTGKTLLAVEKAKRLSRDGKVLLLCFNTLLKNELTQRVASYNVEVHNLQTLIKKYIDRSLVALTKEDLTNNLLKFSNYNWPFKHVIVDEGQDFDPDHLLFLKLLNDDQIGGFFYVFYDKNQLVQQREGLSWRNEIPCQLVLTRNCRNTKNIAKTSYSILELEKYEVKSDIEGIKPLLFRVDTEAQLLDVLGTQIDNFRKDGFNNKDITILTHKTIESSILSEVEKISKYPLNQNTRDNKSIFFTTSRKFKGLESEIILLVDLDNSAFNSAEKIRLFYVATSRAKVALNLYYTGNIDSFQMFVFDFIGRETRFVKQELAKKLNVDVDKL